MLAFEICFDPRALKPDHVLLSVNYAVVEVLKYLLGVDIEIIFPSTYLLDGVRIGGAVYVEGEGFGVVKLFMDPSPLRAPADELKNAVMRRLREALTNSLEGAVAKLSFQVGKHLKNLGEEVRVLLRNGEKVEGEVIGYGKEGDIVILSGGRSVRVKPSGVVELQTLWP